MERWVPAPARERPRQRAGQPSFSSTLLDAICDSLDEHPSGGTATQAAAPAATSAKKQQEAALHCYYYKPSLAASHRAVPAPATADDCSGRGYFSSSEIEYSLRRLRPIRTSAGVGAASVAPAEKHQHHHQLPATDKARRKPSAASARSGGCRRPASPGARLASLINAIFSGKRHFARQHPAPPDEDPAWSTAPSTARPCVAKTPPPSARARPSRSRSSRTVRFLDIDGEVAVAAAAAGCRRVPVVEVEEDSDGGEKKSSDASSDLFELENLAAIAPGSGGAHFRRACGDQLPVYGTTGAGFRHGIGRRRPFGHGSHSRRCSRVV